MGAPVANTWFFTLLSGATFGSFIAIQEPTQHATFSLLAKTAAAELDCADVPQVRLALYLVKTREGKPLTIQPSDAQCSSAISGAEVDGTHPPADANFCHTDKCFFVVKIKDRAVPVAADGEEMPMPFAERYLSGYLLLCGGRPDAGSRCRSIVPMVISSPCSSGCFRSCSARHRAEGQGRSPLPCPRCCYISATGGGADVAVTNRSSRAVRRYAC